MTEKSTKHYLGNENLPNQHATYEYTPERVAQLKKAQKNLLYFACTFFYIINIDSGREVIELRNYQKRVMRLMRDNRFVIVMSSRQSGKTTMMTIYALWVACFNMDQKIVLVANKESTAKDIFGRVRLAYEELPNWVKPGVIEYGKESMVLANGSRIGISTTTGTAARGMSCNVLILDELAFIEPHIVEEFWKSVYPTISSSKKSKIFIASTPNGTENLFYKLYTGAVQGVNGWVADKVTWEQVPGRDEKWKQQNIKLLGSKEAFDQEFGCEFIQAGDNMMDEDLLLRLQASCKEPIHILEEGKYRIWKEPDPGRLYVVGVDVSEGVGAAASCVQVMDVTDLSSIEQIACYHDNSISPYDFVSKLNEILQHWGQPPALIERNNCGGQVVDLLKNNFKYDNIVTYAGNIKTKGRLGIISHTNTKYRGVVNMRYWLHENKCVIIRDEKLLKELKTFVRHSNGTWGHIKASGVFDDRVIGLMWSVFILNEDLVETYYNVTATGSNGKPIAITATDYSGEFADLNVNDTGEAEPFVFNNISIDNMLGNSDGLNSGIESLQEQGWTLGLGGYRQ